MGVVYKAEDTKLGRFVALKFLPYGVAAGLSRQGKNASVKLPRHKTATETAVADRHYRAMAA